MTPAAFKAARQHFGLTQTAWGRCLGISLPQVAGIEIGARSISAPIARLVEMYLRYGVPSDLQDLRRSD